MICACARLLSKSCTRRTRNQPTSLAHSPEPFLYLCNVEEIKAHQDEDSRSCIVPLSLPFLGLHCGEVLLFCFWVCPLFLSEYSCLICLLVRCKGGRKHKLEQPKKLKEPEGVKEGNG